MASLPAHKAADEFSKRVLEAFATRANRLSLPTFSSRAFVRGLARQWNVWQAARTEQSLREEEQLRGCVHRSWHPFIPGAAFLTERASTFKACYYRWFALVAMAAARGALNRAIEVLQVYERLVYPAVAARRLRAAHFPRVFFVNCAARAFVQQGTPAMVLALWKWTLECTDWEQRWHRLADTFAQRVRDRTTSVPMQRALLGSRNPPWVKLMLLAAGP